jgi:ABC-type branched-subunit amino acid transport system substrate-binding protein
LILSVSLHLQHNSLNLLGGGDTIFLAVTALDAGSALNSFSAVAQIVAANVTVVLSSTSSDSAAAAATMLARYNIPMISASSTAGLLSSSTSYPFFVRLVASDFFQAHIASSSCSIIIFLLVTIMFFCF